MTLVRSTTVFYIGNTNMLLIGSMSYIVDTVFSY